MFIDQHGKYYWLITKDFSISSLVEKCPEILIGKFLVIKADYDYDSDLTNRISEEMKTKWRAYENMIFSPRLTSLDELSYGILEDWYVFTKPQYSFNIDSLASVPGFSLRNPTYLLEEADPTWDLVLIKDHISHIQKYQEYFWSAIVRYSPESYISYGDNFIYLTKNKKLFEVVKNVIK